MHSFSVLCCWLVTFPSVLSRFAQFFELRTLLTDRIVKNQPQLIRLLLAHRNLLNTFVKAELAAIAFTAGLAIRGLR